MRRRSVRGAAERGLAAGGNPYSSAMPTGGERGLGRRMPDPAEIVNRGDLAAALTALRERAGFAVRDLAREIDSPAATVGGYLSGRHLPTAAQSGVFRRLLQACGVADPDDVEDWVEAVARIRRLAAHRSAADTGPYRGLDSFQPEDADWFFGREAQTRQLVQALDDPTRPGRMTAVVGPSGSGKSSLVRAGLIPALTGRPWSLLTPGEHPLEALAKARAEGGAGAVLVIDQFEELFTACPDEAERIAFVEELFAPPELPGGGAAPAGAVIVLRADFYGAALRIAGLVPVLAGAQVVVGPMAPADLRRAISEPARKAGFVLEPELVDLLIRDLTPTGAPWGAYDAGALPLLAHALRATAQRAKRGRLTVADYLATGGIAGAVAQTAEGVMATLTPQHCELTRRLFLRLVNVDDEALLTRRRSMIADLPGAGDAAAPASTIEVLDKFIAARLLIADADSVQISHETVLTAWPRLQGWVEDGRTGLGLHRQLSEATRVWLESGRDSSALLRGNRLAAVREWSGDGESTSDLSGSEREFIEAAETLERQEGLAVRRRGRRRQQLVAMFAVIAVLATGLVVFGVQSRVAAGRERELADAATQSALSRQVAAAARKLPATDPNLAAQLSLVAYQVSPTVEARSALLDATAEPPVGRLLGPRGPTMQALSPDGSTLAVGNAGDGSVRLLSIRDPAAPVVLGTAVPATPGNQQFSLAFSPDGRVLAAGSSGGTVELWAVDDPAAPVLLGSPLTGLPSGVLALTFAPDGAQLLAGGAAGAVVRWSTVDPSKPAPLAALPSLELIQALAVSPDGRTLAVGGSSSSVQLWDLAAPVGPTQSAELPDAAAASVTSIAFSPDGLFVAVGARDGAVNVWSIAEPGAAQRVTTGLAPFPNLVNLVQFSADGTRLAAAGSDGKVQIWATSGWQPVDELQHPGPVTGLQLLPNGAGIATSAADGITRFWQRDGPAIDNLGDTVFSLGWLPDSAGIEAATGPAAGAVSSWNVADLDHPESAGPPMRAVDADGVFGGGVAVAPDGRTAAATLTDGRIQLWDISAPEAPVALGAPLAGPTRIVQQLSFSPDSGRLSAAADDASVWVWDVADPAEPTLLSSLTELGGPIYFTAFSPDGRLLATAGTDGRALLYALSDPAAPQLLSAIDAADSYAFTVGFSPDGRSIAVGGADRQVRRWDVSDPSRPTELGAALTGPTNDIYWLDFSPDGRTLIAASTDRSVWMWDVGDPAASGVLASLEAADGQLFTAEFSPDGRRIAAGGSDRSVHQWLADPQDAAGLVCGTVGAPITEAEWQVYLPGRPFAPPCPAT